MVGLSRSTALSTFFCGIPEIRNPKKRRRKKKTFCGATKESIFDFFDSFEKK
jgi:hypothetical protein